MATSSAHPAQRVGVIENSTGRRHVCFTVRRSRRLCSRTHVADKRHSDRGRLPNDEETVGRRSCGDSGNHGFCRGHQQCRRGRKWGRAGHPAPGARPGRHGDAAADGLEHRRQHLGPRRRLRRPRPLRPRDHRAVPLRRREHRDDRQPGVDDHDQARPDVPERRAGRRRGIRPGLELRRLRPQRDGATTTSSSASRATTRCRARPTTTATSPSSPRPTPCRA